MSDGLHICAAKLPDKVGTRWSETWHLNIAHKKIHCRPYCRFRRLGS